ncbi:MAG: DoxX family protein [Mycobacterium sp.]
MTTSNPKRSARILLGAAFTGAGIAHVVKHQWFEQLVPGSLARWRKPISAVTAVIQFVGGISMFIPRLRLLARWTNLAMLIPTLPAAIGQARHPDQMRELGVDPKLVIARIPAQIVIAALTWWATQPPVAAPSMQQVLSQ